AVAVTGEAGTGLGLGGNGGQRGGGHRARAEQTGGAQQATSAGPRGGAAVLVQVGAVRRGREGVLETGIAMIVHAVTVGSSADQARNIRRTTSGDPENAHQTSPSRQSQVSVPARSSSAPPATIRTNVPSSSSSVRARPPGASTQVGPDQGSQPRRR